MNLKKLEKDIREVLQPIIGQTAAKERIVQWILGAKASDDYTAPLLICGQVGIGKSKFLDAIVKIIAIAWPERKGNINFFAKGEDLGSASTFLEDYAANYLSDKNGGLICDELHGASKTVLGLLRSCLQPDSTRKPVKIKHGDGEIIVDLRKHCMVFASDRAEAKLDPALLSRLTIICLMEYSDLEMEQILFQCARENNIIFNDSTLSILSKCFRGTARDVPKILNELFGLISSRGKLTVNKTDIKDLLNARRQFLLGLTAPEVKILVDLEHGPQQLQVLAFKQGMEPLHFKPLRILPFRRGLIEVGARHQLTDKGREYLKELRQHHYELPN